MGGYLRRCRDLGFGVHRNNHPQPCGTERHSYFAQTCANLVLVKTDQKTVNSGFYFEKKRFKLPADEK
jgi:hypothetical protein